MEYMKPYLTSFMRVAALMTLLCSLTFVGSKSASADCGFTLSSTDASWAFTANAGSTQSRTFYVTNTSGGSLTLKFSITSAASFTVNHEQITLANGDTASFTIKFAPGTGDHGLVEGGINISKSGSDCHQTIKLVGTITNTTVTDGLVADPHEFSFGTVAVGTKVCKEVKITNISKDVIGNWSFSHCDNADFTVSFGSFDTLGIGSSRTITICYTPHAASTQASCSLTIKYSGMSSALSGSLVIAFSGNSSGDHTGDSTKTPVLVADPHEFSFGTVDAGSSVCKDVVVSNKGKSTIVVTGWSKCDNADFSITPAISTADTLAAGSSMTFTICYKPHEAGLQASCNLTVKYISIDPVGDGSIVINFSGNSTAHTGTDKVCLHSEQGANNMDAIVIGGSADHTLYLINKSNFDIVVAKADITGDYAKYFAISSTLPITVPANTTTTTLTYTFSPTAGIPQSVKATITFGLTGDSLQCPSTTGVLVGYVVHSNTTTDSVVRPLFPNEKRTLGIEGNGNRTSTSFYFTNNLAVDATVNKVYLADGTYFTISSTNPTPTPFVLHPGDNLTVVVTYTATDKAVHHDQLMIDADHQLQSTSFDLQGVQTVVNSVANSLPTGVAINMSPNPASSYVTVNMAGVAMADVQVYDLLGKLVISTKASTTWKWDASNIVSGSYIVRVSGTSLNGEQFVASKRIIVSK